MEEVNIDIEEVVLDGSSPLSPELVHAALLSAAPAVADQSLAHIAAAVAGHLSSRFGGL
jgi:hypothetical protein